MNKQASIADSRNIIYSRLDETGPLWEIQLSHCI